jgi:FtsH-binding integral membrane protein
MKDKTKEIYQYFLGFVIVAATFGIVALLVLVEIPAGSKEALMLILGQLVACCIAVVNYFFGSSKGSSDKTALLNKINGGTNATTSV